MRSRDTRALSARMVAVWMGPSRVLVLRTGFGFYARVCAETHERKRSYRRKVAEEEGWR